MEKQTRNPAVLVIGAGMSGILLGIGLREAGITDITIVEKGDGGRHLAGTPTSA